MQSDGYYSGISYPAMFHRELTPLWLATTLEALGFQPPAIDGEFTWCELGCGPGFGLAVVAAANPRGRFVGVDINADHIGIARRLAAGAGLRNVEFHLADFSSWSEREMLPPCDFIVLHGVFSWISADKQRAVLKIVERCLKPGGICYLAYMSHPGASPMQSLQRILAGTGEGEAEAALARGFALLDQLARERAGLFAEVPGLSQQLEQLQRQSVGYLAHEFFSQHWRPLHVAEVLRTMEAIGCDYLGSATPIENIDAVSLPQGVQVAIAGIADLALRETAKDVVRNQSQRRDIYQRGRRALAMTEHRQALMKRSWCRLPGAPAPGAVRLETRIGPVDGSQAVFAPVLECLARGPRRFADLLHLPVFQGNGGVLNQVLQMMQWAGWAHPFLEDRGDDECRGLNREISRDCLLGGASPALAVASLGGGLPVGRAEMVFYRVLAENPTLAGAALHAAVRRAWEEAPVDETLAGIERESLPVWRQLGLLPERRSGSLR